MSAIEVAVTFKNLGEAEKVTDQLLKSRLIACANFITVGSKYRWKGKIQKHREILAILKTRQKNWLKVKSEIIKLHSYAIPVVSKISLRVNREAEEWIKREVKVYGKS